MILEPVHDRRRWLYAGIAVGFVGMLIRIWLFQQPVNSDDVQYFSTASTAHSLADLVDVSHPNGMRLTVMILPTIYSALFSPFVAYYATIYTVALLSFASLFVFARVVSGPRAAVIAAAVWATSYVVVSMDTRLTPDNLGTSIALFGLALIAWVAFPTPAGVRPPPVRTGWVVVLAAAGGFLCFVAFGARESFFLFGGVAVGMALLSERRWLLVASVAGGLFAGFLVELVVMNAATGNPLIRFEAAFAYRAQVAEEGASTAVGADGQTEVSIFAGYRWTDLLLRYPRLIFGASAGEAVIFLVGLVGFVVWLARWRDPRNLAKAGCGLAAYCFLAFGIVGVDPIVVLMREKLRYYATAAPLFYLAVAEGCERAVFAKLGGRFARWADHRARAFTVAGLVGVALLVNLWITSGGAEFARNGNDAHWAIAARIQSDAQTRRRIMVLAADGRTRRLTRILMSRTPGWGGTDMSAGSRGYVLLDWKRLNANVRAHFDAAPVTHASYRLLEDHWLVGRAIRPGGSVDAFYRDEPGIARRIERLAPTFPADWSALCAGDGAAQPAVAGAEMCGDATMILYDGADLPWQPRAVPLEGGQFIEVVIDAEAHDATAVRGFLYWWPSHADRPERQAMGTVQISAGSYRYAMWTYLPQAAEAYRVVLRAQPDVVFRDVQTYRISRDPLDDVRPIGEAWPAASIRDARLEAIGEVIREDAHAHGRAMVVHADALTIDAGGATLREADGWRWAALPDDRRIAGGGYVVIDHGRVDAAEAWLDRGTLVARSQRARGDLIDVYYVDDTAPVRAPEAVTLDFPTGWSRMLMGTKESARVDDGPDVRFDTADPDDELVYSGDGLVWRPTDGAAIAGDRLFMVTGEGWAPSSGSVDVILYAWPAGQRAAVKLPMGKVSLSTAPRRFVLWTYLPWDADSTRVVLRSGAGATIAHLEAATLTRDPADGIAKLGAPW